MCYMLGRIFFLQINLTQENTTATFNYLLAQITALKCPHSLYALDAVMALWGRDTFTGTQREQLRKVLNSQQGPLDIATAYNRPNERVQLAVQLYARWCLHKTRRDKRGIKMPLIQMSPDRFWARATIWGLVVKVCSSFAVLRGDYYYEAIAFERGVIG